MSLAYDVIPVTIVTGFLGSGKSTLLADVLQGEAARDTAVLVNEFGAVGLDHLLIGAVEAQTVLLENGCICCAIRGELKDALASLFSRRARGEVPAFSHVVLETTGLATPAPIVATLLGDRVVSSHFSVGAIVTVVDAVSAAHQRTTQPEWLAQVTAADRILISKADLVDEGTLETLERSLVQLNPAARITRRVQSEDASVLLAPAVQGYDFARVVQHAGRHAGHASPDRPRPLARLDAMPAHLDGLASIDAFCVEIDDPVEWAVFTLWFTMLLNRHGDSILRVKGLLALAGSTQPVLLHAVHHLVHPVLHLDAWPEAYGDLGDARPRSRLVFIARGLARDAVSDSYRRFCRHLQTV